LPAPDLAVPIRVGLVEAFSELAVLDACLFSMRALTASAFL
jgi:hypothetical protein